MLMTNIINFHLSFARGEVYNIEDKITHKKYASKICLISPQESDIDKYYREIDIQCQISHPCISLLFGYSFYDFNNRLYILFFMDYYEHVHFQNFFILTIRKLRILLFKLLLHVL